MKKEYKKRIVGIVLLVVTLGAMLVPAQKYFARRTDHNQIRLEGFYLEKQNSLDVVVMGASETYYGYFANEAYRSTGITSYPFSFQYNPVTLWKYELREILKRQKPKVLVIEVNGAGYGIGYDKHKLYSESAIRILSDSMPMSDNKKEMINDLKHVRKDDAASYYWPFLKFHGQWFYDNMRLDILSMNRKGYSPLKGVFSKIRLKPHNREIPIPKYNASVSMDPTAEKSLKEFIKICKKSGIKNVMFVRFPHRVTNGKQLWRHQRYLGIGEVIRKSGYEYLDLSRTREEIGLLPDKDFVDTEHLNAHGARKLTRYLANYIKDKYKLKPTKMSEEDKSKWDEGVRYLDAYYRYYDAYPKKHSALMTRLKRFSDSWALMKELVPYLKTTASRE